MSSVKIRIVNLPIACYYSDELNGANFPKAPKPNKKSYTCIFSQLAAVRSGMPRAFNQDNFRCGGASETLGLLIICNFTYKGLNMNENDFDIDAYLQRINYEGEKAPTVATLKSIHHAQLYTIPFEIFDIQLGRAINLNSEAIFEKLVQKKRGGYCFELNGLFLMVLKAFCFEVRPLLARTHVTGTPTGRGHQIELVTINGRQWIADVGFGGDTPRVPIPLELNQPTIHDGQKIRLVDAGHFGIMLQIEKDDEWIDLYSFDLSHVFPADIDYGNHFTSTHPSSLFVFTRVAALPIKNGTITIFNNMLKKVIAGKEDVTELAEGEVYLNALKTHFGIELGAPYEELRPLPNGQDNGPVL